MRFPKSVESHLVSADERDVLVDSLVGGLPANRLKAFEARMERDYEAIKPYLPPKIPAMLDVGCGLAGLTALISSRHDTEEVTLIDGTGTGDRCIGKHDDTKAWADVMLGFDLVLANSLARVTTDPELASPYVYDLVLSSRSWGLHYPLEVYRDYVVRRSAPGSLVIIDIRHYDIDAAKETFRSMGFIFQKSIESYKKSKRLLFKKQ